MGKKAVNNINNTNNINNENEIKILSTTRKKTLTFYNKYKNLDFEYINDMMVDLFEDILKNISGNITHNLSKELLNVLKDQGDQMNTLKTDLNTIKINMYEMNQEISNKLIIKMFDIKRDYMEEMKLLIDKQDNDKISKLTEIIEKENKKVITEIVSNPNDSYYNNYDNLMKIFKNDIKNTNDIELIEKKYNDLLKNIETSLFNYICKSEERIQNNLLEIKTDTINNAKNQDIINKELLIYLDKYKNSSFKGQLTENHIESILNTIYKSSEIKRTSSVYNSGDFIMYRENMPTILFEIKNYNRNIPKDEVIKFHYDCDNKNISGIMLSISTGICNKHNYQIDITEKNNICLYIHDVNYEIDKIKLGVDIIDNLYSKLNINNKNPENNIQITKEILELINKEYNTFIDKRNTTITHIKESTKKTIQYIEEMELKNLNDLLATKFEFKNTSNLKCSFCNKFIGTNNKSLAVHQRKCKSKYTESVEINTINTSENSEESLQIESNNEIIECNNDDDVINDIQTLSQDELDKILSEIQETNSPEYEQPHKSTKNRSRKDVPIKAVPKKEPKRRQHKVTTKP
jgi:hypothetical protein